GHPTPIPNLCLTSPTRKNKKCGSEPTSTQTNQQHNLSRASHRTRGRTRGRTIPEPGGEPGGEAYPNPGRCMNPDPRVLAFIGASTSHASAATTRHPASATLAKPNSGFQSQGEINASVPFGGLLLLRCSCRCRAVVHQHGRRGDRQLRQLVFHLHELEIVDQDGRRDHRNFGSVSTAANLRERSTV